jgi:hypothetical protein
MRCKITIIKRLLPAFITDFINIQIFFINSFIILQAKYLPDAGNITSWSDHRTDRLQYMAAGSPGFVGGKPSG